MLNRLMVALLAAAGLGGAAGAATVDLQLRGADGRPLAGAVVTIDAGRRVPPQPMANAVMAQQAVAFAPHVLIVPVGATVAFPNHDRVRHHVYSFSRPKRFELKLYGREDSRTVTFDKPGVVALGCNIHDRMSGFIVVVDTALAGLSDAAGRVRVEGVPPGNATLRVWHPGIRTPGNQLGQPVAVPAAGLARALAVPAT